MALHIKRSGITSRTAHPLLPALYLAAVGSVLPLYAYL